MLESFFPKLSDFGYEVTSPESDAYNCIAWAAGETLHWWWPIPAEEAFWASDPRFTRIFGRGHLRQRSRVPAALEMSKHAAS